MPVKFCAQCGTELTTVVESGRERPGCPRCGFIVYRNPIPVALVVAIQDERLLLVHRRNAPLANYWAPPAGYIEIDESLEEGAAREVKEETGLDIKIDRLLHVYSRANAGVFMITFEGHVSGGSMTPSEDEVIEARWYGRNELPSQAAPEKGTLLEQWFHETIEQVLTDFRKPRSN